MLTVENISFSYLDSKTIDYISFTIQKGENIAIIGESGCGKSTLLKLIYGLYDLEEGTILLNDKPALGPKFNLIPGHSKMKYLAQDYDLMPYITVQENVGKFLSNVDMIQKKERINILLNLVEMSEFAAIKVQFLSGGQQQRVALAKVLALEPEILLLDEPFSNIDHFRKSKLTRDLFAYLKQKKITCIIASHDSSDTLSFSDRTFVMRNGSIIQSGDSKKLYKNPSNKYVASLFGEVNIVKVHHLIPFSDKAKSILLYSYELKIIEKSDLKVKVLKCYFKGNHFLIESKSKNEIIFFQNNFELKENETVFLTADLVVIQNRL